jgi:predicted nucleic acid-binding protein
VYLVDTNVISERRKGRRADAGVASFIDQSENELFLPVAAIGELRRGVEILSKRGDSAQALRVEKWLQLVLEEYEQRILPFDLDCALIWGLLTAVDDRHAIDRQIAATALVYDLTVVTRNTRHFAATGVRLLNPFLADSTSSRA